MGVTTIFEPQLSRLDWDISFFLSAPPPPMEGYVVFIVGTIEDGIRGIQNVVGVLKKDRGRLLLLMGGGGGGGGEGGRGREGRKKWNVQLYFQPPNFLFRSAAAR